jgi:hypothetical protein
VRRASAAASAPSGSARSGRDTLALDVAGCRIDLAREDAIRLRAAMLERAGRSSIARDLSVLIDHALVDGRVLALRHVEARTLLRVAAAIGMAEIASRLADAA